MVQTKQKKKISMLAKKDGLSQPIISVNRLSKIYNKDSPAEVKALDKVSIGFDKGIITAIIGPSGSGKSSLLNIIGCMDSATEGSVLLDEVEITKLRENQLADIRKNKIGFIFQEFLLVPTISAIDNVLLPLLPQGIKKKDKERANNLLEKVGLGKRTHHKPAELSGGEKQRCAIARALINKPTIILADEPTGNLDSKTGDGIIALLRELNEELGITIIVVTHDPRVMQSVDKKVEMRDGKIINNGNY
jgi:putative ABC transport system ATP-binding protein